MIGQCYSQYTSLERHFYWFKFILSVRKLWSIYCYIKLFILRNSSVIFNLYLMKFMCVLIPCISLGNDLSIFLWVFGFQWRGFQLLLKYLQILKLLLFLFLFAFPICISNLHFSSWSVPFPSYYDFSLLANDIKPFFSLFFAIFG